MHPGEAAGASRPDTAAAHRVWRWSPGVSLAPSARRALARSHRDRLGELPVRWDLAGLASFLAQVKAVAADPSWLTTWRGSSAPAEETGFFPLAPINCVDATVEAPTIEQIEALYEELRAINPAFAAFGLGAPIACAAVPVTRDPVPFPSAPDAPPVLVIGGGADWRTPLGGAVAMTEALGSARLLTSNHVGHAAVIHGGPCALAAVRDFFVDGVLPAEGTVCSPNTPLGGPTAPELLGAGGPRRPTAIRR